MQTDSSFKHCLTVNMDSLIMNINLMDLNADIEDKITINN